MTEIELPDTVEPSFKGAQEFVKFIISKFVKVEL